jgi:hypothetical protein
MSPSTVLEAAEELRKARDRFAVADKAIADLQVRTGAAVRDRTAALADITKALTALKTAVDAETEGN